MWSSSVDGLLAAETGANLGGKPNSQNFLIHWDGDESRELESGTAMREFGGGTLQSCGSCAANRRPTVSRRTSVSTWAEAW